MSLDRRAVFFLVSVTGKLVQEIARLGLLGGDGGRRGVISPVGPRPGGLDSQDQLLRVFPGGLVGRYDQRGHEGDDAGGDRELGDAPGRGQPGGGADGSRCGPSACACSRFSID